MQRAGTCREIPKVASSYDAFLTELAAETAYISDWRPRGYRPRVVTPTKDADVWLEPFDCAERWADCLLGVMKEFPSAWLIAFPIRESWRPGG